MNQLVLASAGADVARAFIELGVLLIGLGFLARLSHRIGLSPIPAYLAAGLIFGTGGLVELNFAEVMMRRLTITGSTMRPQPCRLLWRRSPVKAKKKLLPTFG